VRLSQGGGLNTRTKRGFPIARMPTPSCQQDLLLQPCKCSPERPGPRLRSCGRKRVRRPPNPSGRLLAKPAQLQKNADEFGRPIPTNAHARLFSCLRRLPTCFISRTKRYAATLQAWLLGSSLGWLGHAEEVENPIVALEQGNFGDDT
jgi:hypothetical protein